MKKHFISVLVLSTICFSAGAGADNSRYHLLSSNPLDFSAPVVFNRVNVTEASAGTIVYDNNSQAFFGLTPGGNPSVSGSWIQLGSATTGTLNVTSASSGNIHVEAVQFGGSSNPSICSSSPCTIYSQNSSNWISSVTRTGAGQYLLNITSGEFNAAPICTCSLDAISSAVNCNTYTTGGGTATSIAIHAVDASGLSTNDAMVSVTCTGTY